MPWRRACLPVLLLVPAQAARAADADADARQAHRLLATRCVACHGAERAEGGWRLDRPEDLATWVVPGRPEASILLQLLRLPADDPRAMPPAGAAPRLGADEIAGLERWIRAGAPPAAR